VNVNTSGRKHLGNNRATEVTEVIAVDSSALVAIIFGEPERASFRACIERADGICISTATALETRMVVFGRKGPQGLVFVDDLLHLPKVSLVPPDAAMTDTAFAAFVAYGRGSGHPAKLNFGDVFSCALAKVRGLPLLFKGSDFSQTDIRSAYNNG
jgi:ribonuclease VapC